METPENEGPDLDFGNIKTHVTDYLKNRIEYLRLSAVEYTAIVAQSIIFTVMVAMVLLIFWLFANVTAAIAIGEACGHMTTGFMVVALVNLFLAIIIILARKALIFKPVSNWIVKILTKSIEADENN